MRRRVVGSVLAVLAVGASLAVVSGTEGAGASLSQPPSKTCALPASGSSFATASPSEEAVDPAAVTAAIAYAQTHLRASVQIFRNNCEIGRGLLDPVTDQVPTEVFSVTKSVVSILTGIAYDQHRLGLDDPIGKYLPTG